MSSLFDITISNDQLTAVVILRKDAPADNVITAEQIKEELHNNVANNKTEREENSIPSNG